MYECTSRAWLRFGGLSKHFDSSKILTGVYNSKMGTIYPDRVTPIFQNFIICTVGELKDLTLHRTIVVKLP